MAKSLNQKKQTELKGIIKNLSVLHKNRSKLQILMRGGASILVKIAVSLVVAFLTDSIDGRDDGIEYHEDEKDVFEVLDGFQESDFDELDIIANDIDLSDIELEDLEAARIELDALIKQIK